MLYYDYTFNPQGYVEREDPVLNPHKPTRAFPTESVLAKIFAAEKKRCAKNAKRLIGRKQ